MKPFSISLSPLKVLAATALLVSSLACNSEPSAPAAEQAKGGNPVVVMTTNLGTVEMELFEKEAPESVANFLRYVDDEFYDNTIFHRVIKQFMIQGGGFDVDKIKKETKAPIKNEADNGLKNDVGTVAMARTSVPDSATSQFFINVKDNEFLNHTAKTARGYGYAVFGKVVGGMDVVNKIEVVPTAKSGGAFQNLPSDPVIIQSIRRKN